MKRKDLGREALMLLCHGFTYGAIGSFFGLSRQRIQQALSPPPHVRRTLLRRTEGYCEGCRASIGTPGHVHHISNQGDSYNSIANLRLLCASCHSKEHPSSLPKPQKKEKPLRPTPTMNGSGLKQTIERIGMNQTKFAKELGVTQAAVSRWINDKGRIRPVMAIHIRRTAKEIMDKREVA